MADPNQPTQPHDFEDGDQEVYRRGRNQIRRRYRRRGRRAKWMAIVAEKDPERHAELEALRAVSPMKFRKALRKTGIEMGFYEFVNRVTDRELPSLEERRKLDEAQAEAAGESLPRDDIF